METKVSSSMGLAMIIVVIGVINMMTIQVYGTSKGIAEAPAELTAPAPSPTAPAGASVYIVYTEKPTNEANAEPFYLKTLTTALGNEKAAKEALLYAYKSVGSAFSCTLNPEQLEALKKTPGVVEVVPSSSQNDDDNKP